MPRRTAVVPVAVPAILTVPAVLTALAGAAALAVALPAAAVPADDRPWPKPVVPVSRQDQLTITVSGEDGAATPGGTLPARRTYTLDCHPAGGSHPDAPAACDAIDRAAQGPRDPWAPVPEDALCTQVYGGPATAHVTGVWRGRPVDATFERTDGCEIARWDALVPALPDLRK